MRLRQLLDDDGAVSPVIGVILMVAITVILAAVIASFVLGLGNQAGEVAPQASFSFDYNSDADNLTISHDGGESIVADQLYVRGNGINNIASDKSWKDAASGLSSGTAVADTNGVIEGQSAVKGGSSMTIGVSDSYEVNIVWESSSGETTSTLNSDTGPQS